MISTTVNRKRWWWLAAMIVMCELTGFVSSLLSNTQNNPWFDALTKPSWNPPDSVFAPVWIILYLLMGMALWVVWFDTPDGKSKSPAITVFFGQLLCNFLWSVIFFRFQSPFVALFAILLLDLLIIAMIILFYRHSKIAAYMMIPYLMWVLFATVLNFSIWRLNV